MLPLPEVSAVPLTKPWYLGLANIRGVLASVVDFGAFMTGEPTVRTPDCRLLLIADRFHSFSGLLISRMLGLKNVQALESVDEQPDQPWVGCRIPRRGRPRLAGAEYRRTDWQRCVPARGCMR